jgi:hypothetical protein
MAGLLSSLFSGGDYRPVTTPIAPHQFVRSPKGFGFGLPWPWEEMPFDALEGVSETPELAVAARRSDGRTPFFVVTERGPWDGLQATDTAAMLQAFASEYMGRPIGIRKVSLAGAPAQVLQIQTQEDQALLLMTSLGSSLLEGLLRIPSPAYLHHFDVFLATWAWLA